MSILPNSRLSIITLGVKDRAAMTAFYKDVIGLKLYTDEGMTMFDMGGLVLGLWEYDTSFLEPDENFIYLFNRAGIVSDRRAFESGGRSGRLSGVISRRPSRLAYHLTLTDRPASGPSVKCPSMLFLAADPSRAMERSCEATYSPTWPFSAGRPINAAIWLSMALRWWMNLESSDITVGGDWTINSGGMTGGSSTVTFNGSAGQFVTSGGGSFNNLIYAGSNTLQLVDTADIDGNFTITAGTFDANGQDSTVAGDWSNSGTFAHGNGTVTFNGSSAQALNSGGDAFNILILTAGGTSPAWFRSSPNRKGQENS